MLRTKLAAASLLLLLAACADNRSYPTLAPRPGEAPRVIEAPGAGLEPALPPEEAARVRRGTEDARRDYATAGRDIASADTALDRALAAAKGNPPGSAPWSAAQTALSRFDIARSGLDRIAAELALLAQPTADLPDSDPVKGALLALQRDVDLAIARHQARSKAAGIALDR